MKLLKPWILTIVGLPLTGLLWSSVAPTPAVAAPEEAPRLVLLVAVDQMRYDYLPRFASGFTHEGKAEEAIDEVRKLVEHHR